MIKAFKAAAERRYPQMVQLRRQFHQNPELANEEYQTARLVSETLTPLGLDLQTGIAGTGVMATLKGGKPGPTVMLRADMDALPIHEANTFDFASRNPGKMHACGHDAHTASLLGAAMILKEMQAEVHGNVRFIFQPSEEKIPGGARFMIEEGILADQPSSPAATSAFGQHVFPHLPTGTIGVRGGMFMASADELYIRVHGQGGHAAAPHLLEADPVLVAAHIITALQSIISRNAPPGVPSVLSIGKVLAEGATNVIPEGAYMEGTLRAMDETWRQRAHGLIERVVTQTAQAFGAAAEVEIAVGYPALYNHPEAAAFVREAAEAYVGPENVVEADLWFAGEDFAYYLQEVPGAFYLLGTGNPTVASTYGLHTPQFTIDEEALRTAPGFMAYLAWRQGRAA